jgi:hypothetical protein
VEGLNKFPSGPFPPKILRRFAALQFSAAGLESIGCERGRAKPAPATRVIRGYLSLTSFDRSFSSFAAYGFSASPHTSIVAMLSSAFSLRRRRHPSPTRAGEVRNTVVGVGHIQQ